MKNLVLLIVGIILGVSCAHHHKEGAHHHHKACKESCKVNHAKVDMFSRYCAQSILEGKLHVKGEEELSLKHGGQIYYFSTEEKRDKFKENLELNAINATKIWHEGSARR